MGRRTRKMAREQKLLFKHRGGIRQEDEHGEEGSTPSTTNQNVESLPLSATTSLNTFGTFAYQ